MTPDELIVHTRDGYSVEELTEALHNVQTWQFVRGRRRAGVLQWKAMLLHGLGRFEESIDAATEAMRIDPVGLESTSGAAAYFRWRAYGRLCLGWLDDAEFDFHHALGGRQVGAVDRLYQGMWHWLRGDDESAIEDWQLGLQLQPEIDLMRTALAWSLVTASHDSLCDGPRARSLLPSSQPITWDDELLTSAVHAANNEFPRAVEHASRARAIVPRELSGWCTVPLEEYRNRQPFRWPSRSERLRFFLRAPR